MAMFAFQWMRRNNLWSYELLLCTNAHSSDNHPARLKYFKINASLSGINIGIGMGTGIGINTAALSWRESTFSHSLPLLNLTNSLNISSAIWSTTRSLSRGLTWEVWISNFCFSIGLINVLTFLSSNDVTSIISSGSVFGIKVPASESAKKLLELTDEKGYGMQGATKAGAVFMRGNDKWGIVLVNVGRLTVLPRLAGAGRCWGWKEGTSWTRRPARMSSQYRLLRR